MSGHSKWSTIKRKKGAADAKRGKIFTKIIKEISVAAREGGADPAGNPRLRLAIQNAKGANMPKDNIDRAIKKATGADAENYQELTYEGYGPEKVALFIECTTDNPNRTVQNVRSYFNKSGGNLGTSGLHNFVFSQKGVFELPVPATLSEDDFALEMIDAGADDVEYEDGFVRVLCALEHFGSVQRKLEQLKLEPENAELRRLPTILKKLDDESFKKAMKLIETLEDDDDVQQVYHNIDASDEQLDLI